MILVPILLTILVHVAIQTDVENANPSICGEVGDCLTECDNKCGCDESLVAYYYNDSINDCVPDMKRLMLTMIEKYNNQDKIRTEAEEVFRGILVSAMFVICCACICALSACIYCCHVNYSDHKLNSDVDALAKKLGRNKSRKSLKNPNRTQQASQSCNVIVEDAGVFVC